MTRSDQRRPSKSSNAITGLPDSDPRTFRPGNGVDLPMHHPLLFSQHADYSSEAMPLKSKQPRIQPLTEPFDPEVESALALLGPPLQLFRILARRPDLARGVAGWGRYYLSRRSALTVRQRELVIDRTTALHHADYEFGVHVAHFGAKAGFTPAQLASLAGGHPQDPCWPDSTDQTVLRAVDALCATGDLDDTTWATLVQTTGENGAVELILVCGWYHAISFTVRALRLPLEPGAHALEHFASQL